MAGKATHKYQAPRGTRDFYPAEMAVRRHIESIWRDVSINHGFDEIEGPTFEHLELYKKKSGDEIVSQLFSFQREGGDTTYALRPEFTPTLARMYAARAGELPKPVKWFCIQSNYRAERPQRGRLREFLQWNADIIDDDSPRADAEIIAVTVGVLQKLGLTLEDVVVKINDRECMANSCRAMGISDDMHVIAFDLLDRRDRLTDDEFMNQAIEAGFDRDTADQLASFGGEWNLSANLPAKVEEYRSQGKLPPFVAGKLPMTEVERFCPISQRIVDLGIEDWCEFSLGIVRGLAYYTGTVFEVHETSGKERSIAGGGRYDKLIELFGGPATPAVGIAMGDVVLRLMLEDRGLLDAPEQYMPRPDVFVINALDDASQMHRLVADLRQKGLHVRHSYRTTKNVGKLLGEAGKARAHFAVILGKEIETANVALKNLDTGEQEEIALDELADALLARCRV